MSPEQPGQQSGQQPAQPQRRAATRRPQAHAQAPSRPAPRAARPSRQGGWAMGLRHDQASRDQIAQRISDGAEVTGSNLYFLILAILIASVGLNMNSTAVVIGAMLISPLMGVIISIAYGISGFRLDVLRRGLGRLALQVAVSVITSTVYFWLSPIDTFSGELVARTTPTIWDALIAFAGGMAAIIANTRKSTISNVIPGAAIATALMPPLCTMGYCLAHARLLQAGTAFYLFCINAIFICLSSVIGLRMMRAVSGENLLKSTRNRAVLAVVVAFAVVPSGFLGYQTVSEHVQSENAARFIQGELQFDNTQVVRSSVDTSAKTIKVALIGSTVSDETIDAAKAALASYGLDGYTLDVTQTVVQQGITASQLEEALAKVEADNSEANEAQQLLSIQTSARELEETTARDLVALYPKVVSAGFVDLFGQATQETDSTVATSPDSASGTAAGDATTTGEKTETAEKSADSGTFALLLMVSEPLTDDELATVRAWASERFSSDVQVIQVTQG